MNTTKVTNITLIPPPLSVFIKRHVRKPILYKTWQGFIFENTAIYFQ